MTTTTAVPLPYVGIRVVEFTHMVMGPTCGMLLADLGAEVIKVEPMGGDSTRALMGSGAGFFPMFNRNKKSIALDLKQPEGVEAALRLIANADIVSENFKSGVMDKLGLGYATLKKLNPRLIYVSHKGFLPGPYDNRTALDEVVQMMGGLAYMTGRPGDRQGRLYFTDQGQTGLHDPTGRVYRWGADGRLDLLLGNAPSPNGIAVGSDDQTFFGTSGPDGLALTADGGLVVAHASLGGAFLLNARGEVTHFVRSPAGHTITNIAFRPGTAQLVLTDSQTGTVLEADMPVAGAALFSHS